MNKTFKFLFLFLLNIRIIIKFITNKPKKIKKNIINKKYLIKKQDIILFFKEIKKYYKNTIKKIIAYFFILIKFKDRDFIFNYNIHF